MAEQTPTEFALSSLDQVAARLAEAATHGTYLTPERLTTMASRVEQARKILGENVV